MSSSLFAAGSGRRIHPTRTGFCLEATSAPGNLLPGWILVGCCDPLPLQLPVAAPIVQCWQYHGGIAVSCYILAYRPLPASFNRRPFKAEGIRQRYGHRHSNGLCQSDADCGWGKLWPGCFRLPCFIAAFADTTSAKEAQHPGEGPQPGASAAVAQKEDAPPAACPTVGSASPADADMGAQLRMDLIPDRCAIACFHPLVRAHRQGGPQRTLMQCTSITYMLWDNCLAFPLATDKVGQCALTSSAPVHGARLTGCPSMLCGLQ